MYYLKGLPNMLSGQLHFLKCVFLLIFQPEIKAQLHVWKPRPTLPYMYNNGLTVLFHYFQQKLMGNEENYLIVMSEAPRK